MILLLVVILSGLALVPLLRGDPDGTAGSMIGSPAPALDATDLDGRAWAIADGAGRFIWVNVWATTCEPCRTEMPAMQALAEAYGDRLLILGLDQGESREAVADFAERYRITYPILLDPTLANDRRWAGNGLPRHYFVDGAGIVVREILGELPPDRMQALLQELIGPVS